MAIRGTCSGSFKQKQLKVGCGLSGQVTRNFHGWKEVESQKKLTRCATSSESQF